MTDDEVMKNTAATYISLALKAHSMPRPYRVGIEYRMRRVWHTLPANERATVERAYQGA